MMLAHTSSIEGSAPHVLQSVLPMLPTNSLLAQSYTNSLDSHVIFHTELESNWTSCLMTLIGHSNFVQAVTPSPDGGLLASASDDKTIKLWDPHTGEHLRTLEGHSDWVMSVAFSPDGGPLASASSDSLRPMTSSLYVYSEDGQGHTLIHDAYTGQLVQTQSEISFPVAGDQNFLTLENHWVCHGVAHIFHLPSFFSPISTWKQRGSLVCFGSQAGQVLILDISNATNILSMM